MQPSRKAKHHLPRSLTHNSSGWSIRQMDVHIAFVHGWLLARRCVHGLASRVHSPSISSACVQIVKDPLWLKRSPMWFSPDSVIAYWSLDLSAYTLTLLCSFSAHLI